MLPRSWGPPATRSARGAHRRAAHRGRRVGGGRSRSPQLWGPAARATGRPRRATVGRRRAYARARRAQAHPQARAPARATAVTMCSTCAPNRSACLSACRPSSTASWGSRRASRKSLFRLVAGVGGSVSMAERTAPSSQAATTRAGWGGEARVLSVQRGGAVRCRDLRVPVDERRGVAGDTATPRYRARIRSRSFSGPGGDAQR